MKIIDMVKSYKKKTSALRQYGDYYLKRKTDLCKILWYYKKKRQYKIAVWGAGLKGTAFIETVDPKRRYRSPIPASSCRWGCPDSPL